MDGIEFLIPGETYLTAQEQLLRRSIDKYVREFTVDRDQIKAALRCGFNIRDCAQVAERYTTHPYFQQALAKYQGINSDVSEISQDEAKKRIVAGLWDESTFRGQGSNHTARVNALMKLATLYGVDTVKGGDEDVSGLIVELMEEGPPA